MIENRIFYFLTTIFVFIILEFFFSQRKRDYTYRVTTNFLLVLASALLLKIAFPFGLVSLLEDGNLGDPLFPVRILPFYIELPLVLIIFDFAIYWQHRFFHKIPYLWNIHKIHHNDESLDLTTALRFHPFEILISGVLKLLLITILSPSALSFFIYEIILSSFAIFNHSNIKIPRTLDSFLRLFIATPSFHTPHHSPTRQWTNSNYGNFLSIWDYLFNSYTKELNEDFGIKGLKTNNFFKLLTIPLNTPLIFKEKEKEKDK